MPRNTHADLILVRELDERLGYTVKLRHSGPIRPQDIGNAVRSSPII